MDAPVGHRGASGGARRARRPRRLAWGAGALLLAALLAGCAGGLPWHRRPPAPGSVNGRLAATAARVVYLEPLDAPAPLAEPSPPAHMPAQAPGSGPAFAAVARGASISFPHDDAFVHRIFSYSEPNAFDLGVAEPGEARQVRLDHAGSVRFYCSLHPWETGLIYVVPSPWFDTPASTGRFEIRGVPPGSYRLRAWSGQAPAEIRTLTVRPGQATALEAGAQP